MSPGMRALPEVEKATERFSPGPSGGNSPAHTWTLGLSPGTGTVNLCEVTNFAVTCYNSHGNCTLISMNFRFFLWETHSFVHSFTHGLTCTNLDAEDAVVNKRSTNPCPQGGRKQADG